MTSTPYTVHSCCAVCNYSTLSVSVYSLISRLASHKKPLRKLFILHGIIILLIPWFLKIVHSENQSKGVHYAKSQRLLEITHAHLQLMESLLDEGKKHNIFKPDIDPFQVNINIAALGGYYLINQHTLGLVYPVRRKTPSFRAGIYGAVFHLTRCLLLFNVLTDGGYWRTSAATGKIARTPQNAFVVIPDCNIWSISSQSPTRYAFEAVYQTGYRQFGRIVN